MTQLIYSFIKSILWSQKYEQFLVFKHINNIYVIYVTAVWVHKVTSYMPDVMRLKYWNIKMYIHVECWMLSNLITSSSGSSSTKAVPHSFFTMINWWNPHLWRFTWHNTFIYYIKYICIIIDMQNEWINQSIFLAKLILTDWNKHT